MDEVKEKNRKYIQFSKLKDYLISLGYKIENNNEKDEGFDDVSILATVRNYLLSVTDGIDFAEEMRNNEI